MPSREVACEPASVIMHADLDAFFAAVEHRDDPALGGRPVIVGGLGPRGVVAAADYRAREYGVRSALPMSQARRACPHAVFLAPRFDAYQNASREVMAIFRDVTPLVEPLALDEAFLDVTGARRIFGEPASIGAALRARVSDEVGLVVSVGIGSSKLVAKLASEAAKPDGLVAIPAGDERAFLDPLPVRRLWGVGPATGRRLDRLGVVTIADVAALPEASLVAALGASAARHVHALAHNRDARVVQPDRPLKSVGHEETYPSDVHERAALERELLRMGERVGSRLRAAGLRARTVQLKVRFFDFTTITRARTLPAPVDDGRAIVDVARNLLEGVDVELGVRLLGVSASRFDAAPSTQGVLFDRPARPFDPELGRAVDAVRARFGEDSVGPATLSERGRLRTGRRGTMWGPSDAPEVGT